MAITTATKYLPQGLSTALPRTAHMSESFSVSPHSPGLPDPSAHTQFDTYSSVYRADITKQLDDHNYELLFVMMNFCF